MPVTGTAVSADTGWSVSELLKYIIAQPVSATLGIAPALVGKVSRGRLVALINMVQRELYGSYLNYQIADLIFTTAMKYDLSGSSPAVERMIDVRVPQSPSDLYVSSYRWDYDSTLEYINFHVAPVSGVTAKLIYSTRFTDLESDTDAVGGDLIGNETVIVQGVMGMLGDRNSSAAYLKNRARRQRLMRGRKTMFPRKAK